MPPWLSPLCLIVVEMPPWLSPLCLALEKNIKIGSLFFLAAQEINLRGNMQGSKCDEYCTFL